MRVMPSQTMWAGVAIAAVAAHFGLFGLLHWLEPQLSPKSSIISDYAETGSVWVATGAFLAFALVWLALAIALGGTAPSSPILTAGRVLFALAVLAILVGTLQPSSGDPRTPSALARVQNLVARPGLFLGIVLVSVGLRSVPGWGDLWPKLLLLSLAAAAMLPVTIAFLLERGLGGVAQRVIFALVYVWVVLVSSRIIATAGRA